MESMKRKRGGFAWSECIHKPSGHPFIHHIDRSIDHTGERGVQQAWLGDVIFEQDPSQSTAVYSASVEYSYMS